MATDPPVAPASAPLAAAPAEPPRHLGRWLGFFLILALVGASLLYWLHLRRGRSMTEDAFVEAYIVNVAPEIVSGRIVRFNVQENDHVQQGQVLAEVDPTHYQDQVDQALRKVEGAEAELRRQEAGLARLKQEVPLQIEIAQRTLAAAEAEQKKAEEGQKLTNDEVLRTIDEAQAALEVARAKSVLAQQEYDRFTELARQDAVTKRRAQEVTSAHDAARAEVQLAEARLAKARSARARIDVAQQDVEVAKAMVQKARKAVSLAETGHAQIKEVELLTAARSEQVKEAQTALTTAKNTLAYTKIRAPFPGVIVKRYRNLGDFASPGVAVLSMYNHDLLYVTANLEETRLPGVAPGNPVELRIDAIDTPLRGRVVWINQSTGAQFALMPRNVVSGEFTKVVQRVPVRILIEKDDNWPRLRAGLSASVAITHGEGDPAWAEQAARDLAELEARYNLPATAPPGPGDRK